MNKRWKFQYNLCGVLCMYAALYPVVPRYFDIFGISAVNILTLSCVLLALPFCKIKELKLPYVVLFVAIHATAILLIYAVHRDFVELVCTMVVFFGMGSMFLYGIQDEELFLRVIDAILWTAGIVCVCGVIEGVTQYNLFEELFNTSNVVINYNAPRFGIRRICCFGSQTISYCAYVMFVMSLCVYRMMNLNSRCEKSKYYILYMLLWSNAILTISRSAILALIMCQILLGFKLGVVKFAKTLIGIATVWVFGSILFSLLTGSENLILQVITSLFALINPSASSSIAESFGTDNLNAVGHRVTLYDWVWESMEGHWLFGYGWGTSSSFNYQYGLGYGGIPLYKQSIEVQYLATLYMYGFIGLVTEIIMYVALCAESFKKRKREMAWEPRMSFGYMMLCTMISYVILMFMVNRNAEEGIFYIFVMLFLAYCTNLCRAYKGNEEVNR